MPHRRGEAAAEGQRLDRLDVGDPPHEAADPRRAQRLGVEAQEAVQDPIAQHRAGVDRQPAGRIRRRQADGRQQRDEGDPGHRRHRALPTRPRACRSSPRARRAARADATVPPVAATASRPTPAGAQRRANRTPRRPEPRPLGHPLAAEGRPQQRDPHRFGPRAREPGAGHRRLDAGVGDAASTGARSSVDSALASRSHDRPVRGEQADTAPAYRRSPPARRHPRPPAGPPALRRARAVTEQAPRPRRLSSKRSAGPSGAIPAAPASAAVSSFAPIERPQTVVEARRSPRSLHDRGRRRSRSRRQRSPDQAAAVHASLRLGQRRVTRPGCASSAAGAPSSTIAPVGDHQHTRKARRLGDVVGHAEERRRRPAPADALEQRVALIAPETAERLVEDHQPRPLAQKTPPESHPLPLAAPTRGRPPRPAACRVPAAGGAPPRRGPRRRATDSASESLRGRRRRPNVRFSPSERFQR